MTGKAKFFWIFYGIALTVLFLLSSTDLIIKEEKAEIYPISVIIGDTSDEQYVNFRKGMERAAMELNGDVSFITLYEKGSTEQQKELIYREQEDGSRALIVNPVKAGMFAEIQRENRISVPVILINAEPGQAAGVENAVSITFDYYGMGKRLGDEIIKAHTSGTKIYLLEDESADGAELLFSGGLREALERGECGARSFSLTRERMPEEFLEEITGGYTQRVVLAALDYESLMWAAQILAETEEADEWVDGLYGRGNTVSALNYLDKGVIRGLCVTDDFSAGYLSVKAAVDLAKNRSVKDTGYLESGYIRREDLRDEKYEKMLYPVE